MQTFGTRELGSLSPGTVLPIQAITQHYIKVARKSATKALVCGAQAAAPNKLICNELTYAGTSLAKGPDIIVTAADATSSQLSLAAVPSDTCTNVGQAVINVGLGLGVHFRGGDS